MDLKIITFNCQSARANIEIITKLLDECDILFLQETFLTDVNKDILENINPEFSLAQTLAVRKIDQFYGRASGGLAIFWRKGYNLKVFPLYFNNRCMGIRLEFGEVKYLLINVYLNCDYRSTDSLIEYKDNLAYIANCMNEECFDEVIVAGDFNCDPEKGRFFSELKMFSSLFDLNLSSVQNLPLDTYTFIGRNQICSTSWLDHVLSSNVNILNNFSVLYGYTFEDHIPLMFNIITPETRSNIFNYSDLVEKSINNKYDWKKASESQISEYTDNLEMLSGNFMYNSVICNETICNSIDHKCMLSEQYSVMLDYILLSSEHLIKEENHNFRKIIGWNENCKELYHNAREAFLDWVSAGRVRFGYFFDKMKDTRKLFKTALKINKQNQQRNKREKFIKLFLKSNKDSFWKEVKKLNPIKKIDTIDGLCNEGEIIDVFSNKYHLKRAQGHSNEDIDTEMRNLQHQQNLNVEQAIISLNVGQGHDGICSEHLKYSGPTFKRALSNMFLQFIRHGFVPKDMLAGQIRPILKNNKLCKTKSDNYRPIMNSSVFLKTFEYTLLPILSKALKLNDQQMGFRNNSSCLNTVMILKEIIHKYNMEGSNVHVAFIDLSKAFDRVEHNKLIKKLRDTDLSGQIINVLDFMLKKSDIHVSIGNKVGKSWKAEIGTRQGGILSPLLFNFYLKESIDKITNQNEGCSLGISKSNILAYADDIVLIAPSASGLQKLVHTWGNSIEHLNLRINCDKSKYMVFKYRKNIEINSSIVLNDFSLEKVQEFKYLGIILNECMNWKTESDRVVNAFLGQFNALYYRFNFVNQNVLNFLFKAYSSSFYGIELWYDMANRKSNLSKVSVAYHKAIKKVQNMKTWDSNHAACEKLGVNLFRHLQMKRMFNYYRFVLKSENHNLKKFKYYWNFSAFMKNNIDRIFQTEYDVKNVFLNDVDAILARIDYVEKHEPRSYFNFVE